MALSTGVYCILNTVNEKKYFGSASGRGGFKHRWGNHLSSLRRGIHGNRHLQSAWNKYGEAKFRFIVTERCLPDQCIEREQHWIDFHESADDRNGYNICPTAGNSLGTKHSPESIVKMRMMGKKRCEDPEHRKRLSDIAKRAAAVPGRREVESARLKSLWKDPEWRRNQSEKRKGKIPAPEVVKKRAEGLKKHWADAEKKAAHVAAQIKAHAEKKRLGTKKPMSLEGRRRLSEAANKRWEDPEERKRAADKSRGQRQTAATKAKMSNSQKKRYLSLEEKRKTAEATRLSWTKRRPKTKETTE